MKITIRVPNHFTVGEVKEVIAFTMAEAERQRLFRKRREKPTLMNPDVGVIAGGHQQ